MKKMMKYAAAWLAVLTLTSCVENLQPQIGPEEKEATVFTATTENPSTKTSLSGDDTEGYQVNWQSGDQITIVDGAGHVGNYTTTSTESSGEFTFVSGSGSEATDPTYQAYYPSTIYQDGTPTLPAVQTYVAGNIHESPMYAESGTPSFQFKNLCGIIRLQVTTKQEGVKVRKILLSADEGMSGPYSLMGDMAVVSGTGGVTLDCGESGVDLTTTAVPFHFSVPQGSYNSLKITIETTDGLSQTKTANKAITVGRSQITDISLAYDDFVMTIDLAATTETVTIPSGVDAKLFGSKTDRTVVVEGGGSVVTFEDASIYKLELNGEAVVVSNGENRIYNGDDFIPVFLKEGSTVTFRGKGTLSVSAYYCTGALICENYNADVVIESGTYHFTAGVGATRAIGAGNLTITGGEVNAISTDNYAGIYAEKTVSISGGTVVSKGDAIGIYVYGGDLLISGGSVTAEQTRVSTFWGGPEAPTTGICVNSPDGTTGGTLVISGGTVNAIGHIGPGIGTSWHRSGWSLPVWTGKIEISGGSVTASTDQSGFAAIGFYGAFTTTRCDVITITEGISNLTLIQGPSAALMFSSGDIAANFTVDGENMTGYFSDPASVTWSFDHLQRTVTTTSHEDDTWVFTPKS